MRHTPPENDNDMALPELSGDDDPEIVRQMHADLAKRGLTLESWAAYWRARAQAVLDEHERARAESEKHEDGEEREDGEKPGA